MTLDELKAELDLRGVEYEDCVSKGELVERLAQSRTLGRADPGIVDRISEGSEEEIKQALNSPQVEEVVARDGGLPGGLSPEMLRSLSSSPEVMQMLKDPKMQDIMRAVMTGGPEAMKKYLSDPDAVLLLQRLSSVMSKLLPKK